jgi:hypothetical protein
MATKEELIAAADRAYEAGDLEAAKHIAQMIQSQPEQAAVIEQSPQQQEQPIQPVEQEQAVEQPLGVVMPQEQPQGVVMPQEQIDPEKVDPIFAELTTLPEIGDSKALNEISGLGFKLSGLANITFKDKEMQSIIVANVEGAKPFDYTAKSGEVYNLVNIPEDGKMKTYWLNKPGLSGQDIAKGATAVLGGIGANIIKQGLGRFGVGAYTGMAAGEAGLATAAELAQASAGGEFNPEDIAIAAAAGVFGEAAGNLIKSGSDSAKSFIKSRFTKPKNETEIEKMTFESLEAIVNKKQAEKLAFEAMPNMELKQLAESRGIDLNPDHFSNNKSFQAFMQAMKADSSTDLMAKEIKASKELASQVNDVVDNLGRMTDQNLLTQSAKAKSDEVMQAFKTEAKSYYNQVDKGVEALSKKGGKGALRLTVKAMSPIKEYMDKRIALLGDPKLLTKEEKNIARYIADVNFTWHGLDEMRKNIGNVKRAAEKGAGEFADRNVKVLDDIYSAFTQTQQGVADTIGLGDAYLAARTATAKQKQIESKMKALYGKDMENSTKLNTAVSSLVNSGDPKTFKKIMDTVPEEMHQQTASTALGLALSTGKRGSGGVISESNLGNFVANVDQLKAQKTSYDEILKYLPDGTAKEIDELYSIAKGITTARSFENTSRTAPVLWELLKTSAGKKGKIGEFLSGAASKEAAASYLGAPGLGVAAQVASTIGGKAKDRFGDTLQQKVSNLVESKAFKTALGVLNKTGNDKPLWVAITKAGLSGLGEMTAAQKLPQLKPVGVPTPQY